MTYKQPFCVGGDLENDEHESTEEDLKGHDPFLLLAQVSLTPSEYVELKSSDVYPSQDFDRSHLKHVFYVMDETMGHECLTTIFAELKDGRLVALSEIMECAHLSVQLWSAGERQAFLEDLKGRMDSYHEPLRTETRDMLFARILEGRTVRRMFNIYYPCESSKGA